MKVCVCVCVSLCVCVCVCVCVFKFSETTGITEAKFHVAPPWDKEKRWKATPMI